MVKEHKTTGVEYSVVNALPGSKNILTCLMSMVNASPDEKVLAWLAFKVHNDGSLPIVTTPGICKKQSHPKHKF